VPDPAPEGLLRAPARGLAHGERPGQGRGGAVTGAQVDGSRLHHEPAAVVVEPEVAAVHGTSRAPRLPIDPSYVTRLFRKLRKGAGDELPPLSFHGLRHCAASLMLASGADIAVVSKLLGHASIAITADVYGHLVGTIAQKAVDGAANLIAHTVHTQQEVDA
jgi:integrase